MGMGLGTCCGYGAVKRLAVIGGGPAGLMAAEVARNAGVDVDLYEAKGSVGRKFLIAGKGGLNLTHSQARPGFDARYGERSTEVGKWLDAFDGDSLRAWVRDLGVDTYVGTSGRVFPMDRKAAPLLRGWVRRLRDDGVRFHVHHRWTGWRDGMLVFETPHGESIIDADTVVLALGGGSWPQLGSDGAWVPWLRERGMQVAPLRPSNCGFDVGWSEHFASRHAGAPLKPVVAHWMDANGIEHSLQGECVATATGVEGSLVYALSPMLRDRITRNGSATLFLDLAPGRDASRLERELAHPRAGRSLSEHLRRQVGITGAKAALVFEILGRHCGEDVPLLARAIKRLPLRLVRPRPVAEAISTAGGVRLEALDGALMSRTMPGVFCAGEMLDWEAPTGGYLLTACFASGRLAGLSAVEWLSGRVTRPPAA